VLLWTPKRQKLIEKARELNTSDFPVIELQERIREICFEYLIEAQVDGDRLLGRGAWRVRSIALGHGVGVGATDGVDPLDRDPDARS
jgi:hypothetical protein